MTEPIKTEQTPKSIPGILAAHSINIEFVVAAEEVFVMKSPLKYFESAIKMYAAQQVAAERERIKKMVKDIIAPPSIDFISDIGKIKNILELIDSL